MIQSILSLPPAGLATLGLVLFLGGYVLWNIWKLTFGSYAVYHDSDTTSASGGVLRAVPNLVCAAADLSGPEERVQREIEQCVRDAEMILPDIDAVLTALDSIEEWEIVHSNGGVSIFSREQASQSFRHLFCVGDSLSGIGIKPNSILTVFEVNGIELENGLKTWRKKKDKMLTSDSVIKFDGFVIDLAADTLTIPNGFVLEKGDVVSLEMTEIAKKRYFDAFATNDGAETSDADLTDSSLVKGRIFGGFEITTDGTLEIVCYRQPEGQNEAIRGGSTHALSKVRGYVIDLHPLDRVKALSLPTLEYTKQKAA